MKIVKFYRKCSDREQQSVEDQDPTYQGRKLSIPSRKCFSIFAKKRNTSSTSCRSTDLESLDEETGGSSEGWVRQSLRQNNSRTSSLSSKWKIFQQQSTSSCDSGVFQDSVKSFRVSTKENIITNICVFRSQNPQPGCKSHSCCQTNCHSKQVGFVRFPNAE